MTRPLIPRPTIWLAATGMALSLLTVVPATAAEAHNDVVAETRFVDSVNAVRAARGLPRLHVSNELRRAARRNSVNMADENHLSHSADLGSQVRNWRRLAENVGRGPSVATVHAALMSSTRHRNNILDPGVTQIGVGVEVRGPTVWVTQVFRRPTQEPAIDFSDVEGGSTHGRNIVRLADAGVTMGCGRDRYCPDRSVTRAEMATLLARSSGLVPRNPRTFADTPSSLVHAANIEAIQRDGITNGCGSSRYCPNRAVTRGEMASFLVRAIGLPVRSDSARYSDVSTGSTHAGAIEALARAGITNGCGNGRYCPDRPVTRAEMASFLVRAYGL